MGLKVYLVVLFLLVGSTGYGQEYSDKVGKSWFYNSLKISYLVQNIADVALTSAIIEMGGNERNPVASPFSKNKIHFILYVTVNQIFVMWGIDYLHDRWRSAAFVLYIGANIVKGFVLKSNINVYIGRFKKQQ